MLYGLAVLTLSVLALDPISSAIDQAQGLAVKKNRKEACGILQRALVQPSLTVPAKQKLQDSLNQIGRVFFTDKGQKLFETAQSQAFENPDLAVTQYQQALQMEDDNVLILANLAKIQIAKKDCASAAALVERGRALNPYSPELSTVELRTLACQKRFSLIKDKARSLPPLNKWGDSFVQYLLAQNHLEEKSPRKAFDILNKVSDEFPQFPESYYYLAKAGADLNKDTESWLERYVSLCKSVSVRERKKYSDEPLLCAHLKEVEDELSRKSTEM